MQILWCITIFVSSTNLWKCSGKARTYPSDRVKEERQILKTRIEELAFDLESAKNFQSDLNSTLNNLVQNLENPKFCKLLSVKTAYERITISSGKQLLFIKVNYVQQWNKHR